MEKLIEQFLEHLRYERNVSSHTLRNYASDLEQGIVVKHLFEVRNKPSRIG